jgi:hypothetical protein
MRYLIQAFLALGVLVAAPLMLQAPEETWAQAVAIVVALILVGLAYRGVVGFVNSRRPKRFPDSIMAPKDLPKKEDL